MKKNRNDKTILLSTILTIIDVASFILCWFFISEVGSLRKAKYVTYILLFIIYLITFILFSIIFDSFAFDRRKITENLYSLFLGTSLATFIFYFLDTLAFRTFYSPLYGIIAIIIVALENTLLLKLFNYIIFHNYVKKNAIIFYCDDNDLTNIKQLPYFDMKYVIKSIIKDPKNCDIDLACDTAFISGIDVISRDVIVEKCVKNDIELYIVPSLGDVIVSSGKYVEELSFPMFKISNNSNALYLFVKRSFDIIISLVALVILSPFMLITALAIKMYDGGPVLYKQIRLTKGGKEFNIYKFRSMKVDAEKDGKALLAKKDDNRITPVGKVIRAIRFDELPQLINIIKGDMSIVGPRPERPEISKQYEEIYPSFNLRLQVKAGLTGYAQVYGKYNSNPGEKIKMDLYYINHRSIIFDLRLCIMTIKILFMKESTEAFDDSDKNTK